MPEYSKLEEKFQARLEVARVYETVTGQNSTKEYWTLCNEQPDTPKSEINQMLSLGMIENKSQFVGVDESKKIIDHNEVIHPEARWYDGEWQSVIREKPFNPSLVYLDGVNLPKKMVSLALTTMLLCPTGCILFVNMPLNNSRNATVYYDFDFNAALSNSMNMHAHGWECMSCFEYNATGHTQMRTLCYRKNNV